MDGHGCSGICGYSDKGGGGGGEWRRVDIPGLPLDGHSYSGIRGYSDMGGGGGGWTSLDYPWMVTVTLTSTDALTWGGVDIPGLSMDGHSYSGVRGYSDMGGWTSLDYPWMVRVTLAYRDTLTSGGGGGGGGWSSLDYPWMVTVTLASADTLTWGGRVVIPGLSVDGQSYSGIQGYSDKGGGRVDIPGLSMDGQLLWHLRIL